ncbi:uncharacterized protein LOC128203537 isoform X2 [Mya arenaria]|uniref:uncharacterized protein LOC128203537 isoform X2 n=1 Tax=Mya arenaria TaxID=6604 RepID=UPI0022E3A58B|nr:uncharacterized protein LOC128203537 isoform X2 [Mya arenaria]
MINSGVLLEKPKVVIKPSSVLPVPRNIHLALTCSANAYPDGNITWTLMKASNSPQLHTKMCLNASTCTYEMTTSDVEQEYLCIAKNIHGSDNGSIIVPVRQRAELTGKESVILGVAIGISGGIEILIIATAVKYLCRRLKQAKLQLWREDNQIEISELQPPTAADGDEVTHTHIDGAEYAVIDKAHRAPETIALPSSKDMPSCEAKTKCVENAAMESLVQVEQPSIEYCVGALESGPSTQRDDSGLQSKDDSYTTDKEKDNRDAPTDKRQERSINNLVYADVHVEHLEKSRVGKRACNEEDRREYSAILFDKSCGVKPDSSNDN